MFLCLYSGLIVVYRWIYEGKQQKFATWDRFKFSNETVSICLSINHIFKSNQNVHFFIGHCLIQDRFHFKYYNKGTTMHRPKMVINSFDQEPFISSSTPLFLFSHGSPHPDMVSGTGHPKGKRKI